MVKRKIGHTKEHYPATLKRECDSLGRELSLSGKSERSK